MNLRPATRLASVILLLAAGLAPAGAARADAFPRRPITLVAPFPAGSITDGAARMLAERFGRALGQSTLVENKPGQEGAIAGRAVAQAAPDGYTMLAGGSTTHSAALALYRTLPYDPMGDLRAVGGVMKVPLLLLVRADFPASDLAGYLGLARERGGKLSFGSGSTASRAAGELLKARAGVEMLHVPYRGIPNALTDLLGGRIDSAFVDPSNALGMIEEGKVRALAVTSSRRLPRLPAVPTIAEAGHAGYEIVPWIGLFVPARTPDAVVDRLAGALAEFHAAPEVRAFAEKVGIEIFPADAAALGAYLAEDVKRWADFVETAKIERN